MCNGIKHIALITIILFLCGCASRQSQASRQAEEARIREAVEAREYVFVAKQVSPQRGGTFPLTAYYSLVVSKDSVNAQLPYFGRAYTAPIDPRDGGISFISTNFSYNIQSGKGRRSTVTIEPKDRNDVQTLILTIFPDGNSGLRVTSINRDMINFEGQIEVRR